MIRIAPGLLPIALSVAIAFGVSLQESPSKTDLDALGKQVESCLNQVRLAVTVFNQAMQEEAAIASKGMSGEFWSNAGPIKIRIACEPLDYSLKPGPTLLSIRTAVACTADARVIDRCCTSELPRMAAQLESRLGIVEAAISRVRQMAVNDAESVIREKVIATGEGLAKELRSLRASVGSLTKSIVEVPEGANVPINSKSDSASQSLADVATSVSARLSQIGVRVAQLADELRAKHGGDFSNPLYNSGGPYRLGTFSIEDSLHPSAVLTSCYSEIACPADRALLQPTLLSELTKASIAIDYQIEMQRLAREHLGALVLESDDANLRDRTLKESDDIVGELNVLKTRIGAEIGVLSGAK